MHSHRRACSVVPQKETLAAAAACGRERKDELEAAWWQEHAELARGPSAGGGSATPAGGSPTKGGSGGGGEDGNMTRKVVHVAAKKQQLLDREVTATSWQVRALRSVLRRTPIGQACVRHWRAFLSLSALILTMTPALMPLPLPPHQTLLIGPQTTTTSPPQEFVGRRDAEAAQLGVLVRSGLYEVDLLLRLMTPGYWPEAQHRVLRGTWFVEKGHDWVPLKETVRRASASLGSPDAYQADLPRLCVSFDMHTSFALMRNRHPMPCLVNLNSCQRETAWDMWRLNPPTTLFVSAGGVLQSIADCG